MDVSQFFNTINESSLAVRKSSATPFLIYLACCYFKSKPEDSTYGSLYLYYWGFKKDPQFIADYVDAMENTFSNYGLKTEDEDPSVYFPSAYNITPALVINPRKVRRLKVAQLGEEFTFRQKMAFFVTNNTMLAYPTLSSFYYDTLYPKFTGRSIIHNSLNYIFFYQYYRYYIYTMAIRRAFSSFLKYYAKPFSYVLVKSYNLNMSYLEGEFTTNSFGVSADAKFNYLENVRRFKRSVNSPYLSYLLHIISRLLIKVKDINQFFLSSSFFLLPWSSKVVRNQYVLRSSFYLTSKVRFLLKFLKYDPGLSKDLAYVNKFISFRFYKFNSIGQKRFGSINFYKYAKMFLKHSKLLTDRFPFMYRVDPRRNTKWSKLKLVLFEGMTFTVSAPIKLYDQAVYNKLEGSQFDALFVKTNEDMNRCLSLFKHVATAAVSPGVRVSRIDTIWGGLFSKVQDFVSFIDRAKRLNRLLEGEVRKDINNNIIFCTLDGSRIFVSLNLTTLPVVTKGFLIDRVEFIPKPSWYMFRATDGVKGEQNSFFSHTVLHRPFVPVFKFPETRAYYDNSMIQDFSSCFWIFLTNLSRSNVLFQLSIGVLRRLIFIIYPVSLNNRVLFFRSFSKIYSYGQGGLHAIVANRFSIYARFLISWLQRYSKNSNKDTKKLQNFLLSSPIFFGFRRFVSFMYGPFRKNKFKKFIKKKYKFSCFNSFFTIPAFQVLSKRNRITAAQSFRLALNCFSFSGVVSVKNSVFPYPYSDFSSIQTRKLYKLSKRTGLVKSSGLWSLESMVDVIPFFFIKKKSLMKDLQFFRDAYLRFFSMFSFVSKLLKYKTELFNLKVQFFEIGPPLRHFFVSWLDLNLEIFKTNHSFCTTVYQYLREYFTLFLQGFPSFFWYDITRIVPELQIFSSDPSVHQNFDEDELVEIFEFEWRLKDIQKVYSSTALVHSIDSSIFDSLFNQFSQISVFPALRHSFFGSGKFYSGQYRCDSSLYRVIHAATEKQVEEDPDLLRRYIYNFYTDIEEPFSQLRVGPRRTIKRLERYKETALSGLYPHFFRSLFFMKYASPSSPFVNVLFNFVYSILARKRSYKYRNVFISSFWFRDFMTTTMYPIFSTDYNNNLALFFSWVKKLKEDKAAIRNERKNNPPMRQCAYFLRTRKHYVVELRDLDIVPFLQVVFRNILEYSLVRELWYRFVFRKISYYVVTRWLYSLLKRKGTMETVKGIFWLRLGLKLIKLKKRKSKPSKKLVKSGTKYKYFRGSRISRIKALKDKKIVRDKKIVKDKKALKDKKIVRDKKIVKDKKALKDKKIVKELSYSRKLIKVSPNLFFITEFKPYKGKRVITNNLKSKGLGKKPRFRSRLKVKFKR